MEKCLTFLVMLWFLCYSLKLSTASRLNISMHVTGQSAYCDHGGYLKDKDLLHVKGTVTGFSNEEIIMEFRNVTGQLWQKLCSFKLQAPDKEQATKSLFGCYCYSYTSAVAGFFLNVTAKNYSAFRAALESPLGVKSVDSSLLELPRVYGEPVMYATLNDKPIMPYGNCSLAVDEDRIYTVRSCYMNLFDPATYLFVNGHFAAPQRDRCVSLTVKLTSAMTGLSFLYHEKCRRTRLDICRLHVQRRLYYLLTKYVPWLIPVTVSALSFSATFYILYYFKLITFEVDDTYSV